MVGVNARYAVGRDAISHRVYSVIGVIAGRLGASVTNSARAVKSRAYIPKMVEHSRMY